MSKGLIRTTIQPDPLPDNWIATSEPDLYLCAPMPATLPPGAEVIGEWLDDGTLVDATSAPGGVGTPLSMELAFHHFMGDAPRQWVMEQFPPSDFSPEFSEEFA